MFTLAAVLFALSAVAQEPAPDPPLALISPPRIDASPGDVRLAPRLPDREPALEEVIVVSEQGWRLPDLGSTWRQEQKESAETGRIEVRFFPLYDPENDDPNVDLFPRDPEMQRVGFIEIFRLRFGGERTTD